ncbi:MAG: hypothetical protein ABT940_03915, partial [Alphaproteobacteria bacterium]
AAAGGMMVGAPGSLAKLAVNTGTVGHFGGAGSGAASLGGGAGPVTTGAGKLLGGGLVSGLGPWGMFAVAAGLLGAAAVLRNSRAGGAKPAKGLAALPVAAVAARQVSPTWKPAPKQRPVSTLEPVTLTQLVSETASGVFRRAPSGTSPGPVPGRKVVPPLAPSAAKKETRVATPVVPVTLTQAVAGMASGWFRGTPAKTPPAKTPPARTPPVKASAPVSTPKPAPKPVVAPKKPLPPPPPPVAAKPSPKAEEFADLFSDWDDFEAEAVKQEQAEAKPVVLAKTAAVPGKAVPVAAPRKQAQHAVNPVTPVSLAQVASSVASGLFGKSAPKPPAAKPALPMVTPSPSPAVEPAKPSPKAEEFAELFSDWDEFEAEAVRQEQAAAGAKMPTPASTPAPTPASRKLVQAPVPQKREPPAVTPAVKSIPASLARPAPLPPSPSQPPSSPAAEPAKPSPKAEEFADLFSDWDEFEAEAVKQELAEKEQIPEVPSPPVAGGALSVVERPELPVQPAVSLPATSREVSELIEDLEQAVRKAARIRLRMIADEQQKDDDERRMSFRIAVPPETLSVSWNDASGAERLGRVINISFHGVLFEAEDFRAEGIRQILCKRPQKTINVTQSTCFRRGDGYVVAVLGELENNKDDWMAWIDIVSRVENA